MTDGSIVAPEIRYTSTREWRDWTADFTDRLRTGETLTEVTGTYKGESLGVVSEDGAITIGTSGDAPAINAGALTTDDPTPRTIAIGKAVQYWAQAANATPGETYEVSVRVKTSANRLLEKVCRHKVER